MLQKDEKKLSFPVTHTKGKTHSTDEMPWNQRRVPWLVRSRQKNPPLFARLIGCLRALQQRTK